MLEHPAKSCNILCNPNIFYTRRRIHKGFTYLLVYRLTTGLRGLSEEPDFDTLGAIFISDKTEDTV